MEQEISGMGIVLVCDFWSLESKVPHSPTGPLATLKTCLNDHPFSVVGGPVSLPFTDSLVWRHNVDTSNLWERWEEVGFNSRVDFGANAFEEKYNKVVKVFGFGESKPLTSS